MIVRTIKLLAGMAVCIVAISCIHEPPIEPTAITVEWENYDFSDGLGKPSLSTRAPFVGTPIEGGAAILDFWIHERDQGETIWAISSALMRSDDLGASWQVIEDSLKSEQLGFAGPNRVVVTEVGHIWVSTSQRIFRSVDNGTNWEFVYQGPPDSSNCVGYSDIAVDGRYLWLSSSEGIVFRADTETLEVQEMCRLDSPAESIMLSSSGAIYVGTPNDIKVSTDGGASFETFSVISTQFDLVETSAGVYCISEGRVVELDFNGTSVWTSESHLPNDFRSICTDGEFVYALNLATTGTAVLRIPISDPSSATKIDLGGVTTIGGDIYYGSDANIYVGLSGRVLISGDCGDTWSESLYGVSTVNRIAVNAETVWAGLEGSGAAVFNPLTGGWNTVGSRLERGLAWRVSAIQIHADDRVLLAGGPEPEIAITADGGDSFRFVWFDSAESVGVQDFAMGSGGELFMLSEYFDQDTLTNSSKLHISNDLGETWAHTVTIISELFYPPRGLLEVDDERACIWALFWDVGLYRGSVDGTSWQPDDSPIGITEGRGMSLLGADLYVSGTGIYGTGIYIYRSSDTWDFIAFPYVPAYRPNALHADYDGWIWLATELGLYCTATDGESWSHFTKEHGLASDIVLDIQVVEDGPDKIVWVGTALGASRGVVNQF